MLKISNERKRCIINSLLKKLLHYKVISHLEFYLHNKQIFINQANCMNDLIKGDGSGLGGGILVDVWINDYFNKNLKYYEEYHNKESDFKICGVPFSFKKITGPSNIALSWSKNKETSVQRDYWEVDIMILNLKGGQWWKKGPTKAKNKSLDYTMNISPGLYIINKTWAKKNIKLTSNNKTSAYIDKQYVYEAIVKSIHENIFLPFPSPKTILKPSFLKLFE